MRRDLPLSSHEPKAHPASLTAVVPCPPAPVDACLAIPGPRRGTVSDMLACSAARPRSNPSVTPSEPALLPAIAGWTGEAEADVDDDVPNIRISILQCYRLVSLPPRPIRPPSPHIPTLPLTLRLRALCCGNAVAVNTI